MGSLSTAACPVIVFTICGTALSQPILWRDPGNIAGWDFGGTAGTTVQAPKPPYTFLREDLSGTQPKILVQDAAGATWDVKFGYEVKVESFCWRVVHACGYFVEPSYFVAEGQVVGLQPLRRAGPWVRPDGHFTNGRFQYRDSALKFLERRSWRWDGPPFAGAKELSGLKVLIMLFSNWDNKDGRVGAGGPNTAVFEQDHRQIYAFTDWGSGMGLGGDVPGRESNWRCEDYSRQTPDFVRSVDKGRVVVFGYQGYLERGFDDNIPPAHVAWLMQYLGRITDAQLAAGLKASGATESESACFTRELRRRIEQLRNAR
ncbi:MAG: hypothetical protein C5B51_20935 [Terriglobia bacterium]|nr:MAG: hypothetical protein C5B51_20935 [Terriglobia bacterium]